MSSSSTLPSEVTPTETPLADLDAKAQADHASSIVGRDVREAEVQGLLYLAEFGKDWTARMWAIFALGRAKPFASLVLPKLVALLQQRPIDPERLIGTLSETIGKLPGAVEHLQLLIDTYRDTTLWTETRSIAGVAITHVLADPETNAPIEIGIRFAEGVRSAEESCSCAILRKLIEEHVHDAIVVAAAKVFNSHPPAHFRAARSVLEKAAANRYTESIATSAKAALAHLDSVA